MKGISGRIAVVLTCLACAGPAQALDNDGIAAVLERLNVEASGEE